MGRVCNLCGGYQPARGESWGGRGCTCATVPLRKIIERVQYVRNSDIRYHFTGNDVVKLILNLTGTEKCIDHYLKKVNGIWEIKNLDDKKTDPKNQTEGLFCKEIEDQLNGVCSCGEPLPMPSDILREGKGACICKKCGKDHTPADPYGDDE